MTLHDYWGWWSVFRTNVPITVEQNATRFSSNNLVKEFVKESLVWVASRWNSTREEMRLAVQPFDSLFFVSPLRISFITEHRFLFPPLSLVQKHLSQMVDYKRRETGIRGCFTDSRCHSNRSAWLSAISVELAIAYFYYVAWFRLLFFYEFSQRCPFCRDISSWQTGFSPPIPSSQIVGRSRRNVSLNLDCCFGASVECANQVESLRDSSILA